jgi:hypothetical protein
MPSNLALGPCERIGIIVACVSIATAPVVHALPWSIWPPRCLPFDHNHCTIKSWDQTTSLFLSAAEAYIRDNAV